MNDMYDDNQSEALFLEPIKAGHLFFYDSEHDEIVHFRKEIYEAAQRNSEGIDIDLTESEQDDAEDAWEILADEQDRYQAMPPITASMVETWKQEFAEAKLPNWEEFQVDKTSAHLLDWLESFQEDDDGAGEMRH